MYTDAMEFTEADAPDELRKPKLVEKSTCHLVITEINDLINDKEQTVYGFELTLQVVGSNVADQENKTFKSRFADPNPSHRDGGEFCRKQRKALALATGLVPLPASGKINLEWERLVDLQLVAKVDQVPWQTDKSKFNNEIAGCNMWHIDEPAVANIPKNAVVVENCVGHRWTAEMIADASAKLAETNKSKRTAGSNQPAATAGAAAPAKQDWASI